MKQRKDGKDIFFLLFRLDLFVVDFALHVECQSAIKHSFREYMECFRFGLLVPAFQFHLTKNMNIWRGFQDWVTCPAFQFHLTKNI